MRERERERERERDTLELVPPLIIRHSQSVALSNKGQTFYMRERERQRETERETERDRETERETER